MDAQRRRRTGFPIVLLLCLALAGASCGKANRAAPAGKSEGPGEAAAPDTVVLRVEATDYTVAAFEKYLKLNAGDDWASFDARALSRLFDNFVQEKLLLERARTRRIVLTDEERAAYLAKLKSAATTAGSDAAASAFDEEATAERLLVEKYLSTLLDTLNVDDAAVAQYYDGHKNEFLQSERVQVSQILLEKESQATALLEKLRGATEEEFRAAARTQSKGVEAAKGGLLGEFSAGQLPAELEKAVFLLKTGEVSRVVESSYGWHIFRLDKRFETRLKSLAEAAPGIRAKLLDAKGEALIASHVEEIRASADWKEDTDKLPFPYQRIES